MALIAARTEWFAVASFYRHWHDLNDGEVILYLGCWVKRRGAAQQLG